jgi:hypothetical protein
LRSGKEIDMDGNDAPSTGRRWPLRRWVAPAGLVATGLVVGGIMAGSHLAGAEGSSSGTQTAAVTQATNDSGHGPDETLLTGSTASRVRAAALEAVPGATILRVETDSEGSPYEAHVRKSDGTVVTVKVDEAFNVTATETGFGQGHAESQSDDSGA